MTAPRHSTKIVPASTVASSSSAPVPTDPTCAPSDSHFLRITGSLASVQQQTTSAPRTALSKVSLTEAFGWREASVCA